MPQAEKTGFIPFSGRPIFRGTAAAAASGILFIALCATTCDNNPSGNCNDPVSAVALQLVADGFVEPTGMAFPHDGSGRLFVLDLTGKVYIIEPGDTLRSQPFLDLNADLVSVGIDFGNDFIYDERGLLGMAFHPDYSENGRFFIYYNTPKADSDPDGYDSRVRLSEFHVSDHDPNTADPASERVLLEVSKPQFNHNGGQLEFGPDGFLYVGIGDGGNANDDGEGHNDVTGNAQDKSVLLGKILRIDVDGGDPYGIPADNPFMDEAGAMPEIFAYGLRNPWRFSFDSTGRLFVGDVGQDQFEEVDVVEKGKNYGWRIREADNCFDKDNPSEAPNTCPDQSVAGDPLVAPIVEYPHSAQAQPFGISVTGGYLYEGDAIPCLKNEYVFGDWSTQFTVPDGTLFAASENADGTWTTRELAIEGAEDGRIARFITSFGRDQDGELYILSSATYSPKGRSGRVHRIVAPN